MSLLLLFQPQSAPPTPDLARLLRLLPPLQPGIAPPAQLRLTAPKEPSA